MPCVYGLVFSGQTFVVIAISAHSPSVYALCATADIPLSYVWGRAWLGQRLYWYHFLGAGLICAGIFAVSCPDASCRDVTRPDLSAAKAAGKRWRSIWSRCCPSGKVEEEEEELFNFTGVSEEK